MTQKLPSTASAQDLSKMKFNKHSTPISEMDDEGGENDGDVEDVPDDDHEQSRISNINSMDPVQWSNVKRDIVAENRRQEAIKQRLLYPQQ